MSKTIAIIGNGKLTLATVKGFLASGMESEKIIVIGRENSNLSVFEKLGVLVSKDIMQVKEAKHAILMVTPSGIGPQLKRLKETKIENLTSFASGSNISDLSRFLGISPKNIRIGTMNVNVEYGKGLVYMTRGNEKIKELMGRLGKVTTVSPTEVPKLIVSVGSGCGVDAQALLLMYEASKSIWSFRKWLEKVEKSGHPMLNAYIENKAKVFTEVLGYDYEFSLEHSAETLLSTILALLSQKGEITFETIEEYVRKVATKRGCTEAGIGKMTSVDVLFSFEKLLEVIHPIYERAKKFEDDAKKSFDDLA